MAKEVLSAIHATIVNNTVYVPLWDNCCNQFANFSCKQHTKNWRVCPSSHLAMSSVIVYTDWTGSRATSTSVWLPLSAPAYVVCAAVFSSRRRTSVSSRDSITSWNSTRFWNSTLLLLTSLVTLQYMESKDVNNFWQWAATTGKCWLPTYSLYKWQLLTLCLTVWLIYAIELLRWVLATKFRE